MTVESYLKRVPFFRDLTEQAIHELAQQAGIDLPEVLGKVEQDQTKEGRRDREADASAGTTVGEGEPGKA